MTDQTRPNTCVAAQSGEPASLKSVLDTLFGEPRPRCGKPAEYRPRLGMLCQECYDRIETGRKNRTNLLGILEEAFEKSAPPKKRDKDGNYEDPIEMMHGHKCGPNCWHNALH